MGELKLIIQPDDEEIEAAEVYVEGSIGDHPYRFLLDTGAARSSVLFDDYFATFSSLGSHYSSGVFGVISEDLITVPSLTLGPISRQNFTLTRATAHAAARSHLIGMDVLKDYCCHFLFNEARVLINSDEEADPAYPFQPLFLDQKFHPYVDVHLGSAQAKAVWDTGASLTIADTGFIQRHRAFFADAGQSAGTDAGGNTVETPMFVLSGMRLGDQPFPPHKVAGVDLSPINSTLDMPMDLILGYSTLRHANWWFDFPRKQWRISK